MKFSNLNVLILTCIGPRPRISISNHELFIKVRLVMLCQNASLLELDLQDS